MDWDRTQPQDPRQRERVRHLSAEPTAAPADVPGYRMERFLGQGAYGQVWVAVDQSTGRRVAIKFYTHHRGLDWSLLSREVEKLAFLFSDRYVVQLLSVNRDADPPYYVMEYLEHGSLEDKLHREGPLPAEEAVRLGCEIATGLLHAHSKGVLHCDLKPANVLLDQDQRPRLCDFGQSRLVHEQTPALGTLFYMAPEQADGQAVPDARWDVYALGALLYCMLTGSPPHRTPENLARLEQCSSTAERLRVYQELISSSGPPRVHREVPGVDRALGEIVARCLQPRPEDRFPTIQAVLDALRGWQRRQHRRALVILGAVGPALILVVTGYFAYRGFSTTMTQSAQALLARALQSNRFAAWYVAETVAAQVLQRWQALEQEALDPQLVALLEQLNRTRMGSPQWQEAQKRLQQWLQRARARHANLSSTSWFVNTRNGTQVARDPLDPQVLNRNFAYRDYFHGQGRDYAPGRKGLAMIRQPHLSVVFVSRSTGNRMVAFSVPVFAHQSPQAEPIGILAMTVELGRFTEVQRDEGSLNLVTALVDTKADSRPDGTTGRPGSLLEHPFLARLQAQKARSQRRTPLPDLYLPPALTQRAVALVKSVDYPLAPEQRLQLALIDHYEDPVPDPRFAGPWIAAMEPVVVRTARGRRATGWVVVVQERRGEALSPLAQLRHGLVQLGWVALWAVLGVLGGVWLTVWAWRHQSPVTRWWRRFQRRMGWGPSTWSATGTSPKTPAKHHAPTVPQTKSPPPE